MRPHVCGTIFCTLLFARACYSLQQGDIADIVKRSSDAVVLITISDASGHDTALGSGFLVSADGEIVTNLHVIKGASSAIVKLSNGAFFPVTGVLASDTTKDLAVIKVDGKNLPFLALADMDKINVGEHVVAIGSPLGLEGTVSDGVISAIRDIGERKLIQTTAPASHGNSGGPLLNMNSQVVGVIALGINPELGQNLNFAVPCGDVTALILTARQKVKPLETAAAETEDSFSEGAVWTSLTSGHDLNLRHDGNYLYVDIIDLPQISKEGGGFIRGELKEDADGKWRGKQRARLPCSYTAGRGIYAREATNWCSTERDIEIDLMSPRRIEGLGTTYEKFDCRKCEDSGKPEQKPFTWIPK
jgi:Trypsin-like peptidase domain